ncbi:MAG: hypothetical protein ACFBSG_02400 [Leptolyngbyaceae cyanobacterium]
MSETCPPLWRMAGDLGNYAHSLVVLGCWGLRYRHSSRNDEWLNPTADRAATD